MAATSKSLLSIWSGYSIHTALLLLLLLFVSARSQETTSNGIGDCTPDQIANCINIEGNRSCYGSDGKCLGCIEDFVELPEEVLDLTPEDNVSTIILTLNMTKAGTSNGTICAPIEALTTALYERVFKPLWQNELESEERLEILLRVAKYISQTNQQNLAAAQQQDDGLSGISDATYTLALNEFSADTVEEAQKLAGYRLPSDGEIKLQLLINEELDKLDAQQQAEGDVPTHVDWVERGAVTSVKNQGRCGCCWSISTAGALEGAAAIWSNFTYLQSLSFQQLISCDKNNNGCNGGFPAAAIRYANDNLFGGTASLNDYPFTDEEGTATTECQIDDKEIAVESQLGRAIVYYGSVGDTTYETRMSKMKLGVSRQPVAIAVKSLCDTWKNYASGVVIDDGECSCSPLNPTPCLDHAVLLVGYNDDHNPPYWKIKNSWGTGWGEDGYIRIAQANPTPEEPNSWGLFGLLAEGVVPLQAFNQTQQVPDEPQTIGGMKVWAFVLLLVGIVVGCCVVGICVRMMMKRKQES